MRGTTLILCVSILWVGFVDLSAIAQNPHANRCVPSDRFLGTWKSVGDKGLDAFDSEVIAIECRDNDYKITSDTHYRSGNISKYWILTPMDGSVATATADDGRPMNERWRVTRDGPNSFTVETSPFRSVVKYELSADGKTMKVRQLVSSIVGYTRSGTRSDSRILVFFKVVP